MVEVEEKEELTKVQKISKLYQPYISGSKQTPNDRYLTEETKNLKINNLNSYSNQADLTSKLGDKGLNSFAG